MHKFIYFTLFIIVFLFSSIQNTFAVESNNNFDSENLPQDIEENFITNINLSKLLEEPQKQKIVVFDVNENGLIAIGSNHINYKTICIYTNTGIFQYGYKFNSSGSFGVEWSEDNINIYFVRSDVAIKIDSQGNIKSIKKILNTTENNDYWNNVVFTNSKSINGIEYSLKNNLDFLSVFSTDYLRLVKIDDEGKESIIYTANQESFLHSFTIVLVLIVFVTIVFLSLKKEFEKQSKTIRGQSGDG